MLQQLLLNTILLPDSSSDSSRSMVYYIDVTLRIVTVAVSLCSAYFLSGSSYGTNARGYTGILTSMLCAVLTFAFVEPPFATVGSELTLAHISPYFLMMNATLVGLALGVMLPTVFPGICFGASFALFLTLLCGSTIAPFHIIGTVLVILASIGSAKFRLKEILTLASIWIGGATAASLYDPLVLDAILNAVLGYDRHSVSWGATDFSAQATPLPAADPMLTLLWFIGCVITAGCCYWRDQGEWQNLFRRYSSSSYSGVRYSSVPATSASQPAQSKRTVIGSDYKLEKQKIIDDLLPKDEVYNMFNPVDLPPRLSEFANMVFSACEDLGNFFGFQDQSVRNQAEHLLILLSNNRRYMTMSSTPPHSPIHALHAKVFSNYVKWCKAMSVRPNFAKMNTMCVSGPPAVVSRVVDLVLWFCIWGEGANLRHMPECMWYLYHRMMESYTQCEGYTATRSLNSGHFLDYVVTPIYDVVVKCKNTAGDHEAKKNYDDINEFFWSNKCLAYRYSSAPLEDELLIQSGGAGATTVNLPPVSEGLIASPKTFLEKRSWLRGIMALNRILEWHIVTFYLLAVIAFSRELVWGWVYSLQIASGVFWIYNGLGLTWELLEVWAAYPGIELSGTSVIGSVLKIFFRFLVLVYQTLYLTWVFAPSSMLQNSSYFGLEGTDANFWWWQYVWLSLLCMMPYIVEVLLNFYPVLTTRICTARNDYLQAFLNILYPMSRLYVGKEIHESLRHAKDYMIFWLSMIAFKLAFSYQFEVFAMVKPSLELTDDYINYHNTSFAKMMLLLLFRWLPQFLVYTIDMSIWYSLWQAFAGTAVGLEENLGAVRDMEGVRANFSKAPAAFCQKMLSDDAGSRRGSSANFNSQTSMNTDESSKLLSHSGDTSLRTYVSKILDVRMQKWIMFSFAWNEVIDQMRVEDIISNRERDFLKFSQFKDDNQFSQAIYLPVFQTAGVIDAAIDVIERPQDVPITTDRELFEPIYKHDIMSTAVSEVFELSQFILRQLLGERHTSSFHEDDLTAIIKMIYTWVEKGTLLDNLKMANIRKPLKHLKNLISLLDKTLGRRKPVPKIASKSSDKTTARKSIVPDSSSKRQGLRRVLSASSLATAKSDLLSKSSDEFTTQRKPIEESLSRKSSEVVADALRDKVQDCLRNLIRELKGILKNVNSDENTLKALDDLTMMSMKTDGFFRDSAYASEKLDRLCKDDFFKRVLTKANGLLNFYEDDVEPRSKEAKRRLTFFVNSLFMDIPDAPRIEDMHSMNVMTPYYSEDVIYSKTDLEKTSDALGVSTLLYLQTLYGSDWKNFLERMDLSDETKVFSPKFLQETRMWASLRAQTLARTVSGMMYYESALRLLANLERNTEGTTNDLMGEKFGYIVACQVYGTMKKNQDPKADDIEWLMHKYPHMRVAYIDSVRLSRSDKDDILFFSVLVKSDGNGGIQEVYRVRLPGNAIVGEGKPENQNHAIIFSRSEFIQTIDMNQEGYFEEALKLRNTLQEFGKREGPLPMTILGLREHIFTGSVSSLANYMALQETSFVTLGQRVLTKPLRMRFHYGHPDIFDKLFFITRGGISKSSKGINLSEDIFAGYNNCIRGGSVGFKEYMQVGKGRDVGMSQIYKFEAKLAQGNAEQSLSRDVYRLGQRLDFFRLFSMYFGGIGHYFSTVLTIITVYVVVYLMAILAMYDFERIGERLITPMGTIQMLLGGLGLLQTFPLIATLGVERGWSASFAEVFQVFASGGPLHFMFHIQTKANYMTQTILVGNAQYRATGRGFVTQHTPFDEQYRFFASSHMYLGVEIAAALILMGMYTQAGQYFGRTWSLWLAAISFLASPFWFNPLTFDWKVVTSDYNLYLKWLRGNTGGAAKSWSIWWNEENSYYSKLPLTSKLIFVVKALVYVCVANGIQCSSLSRVDTTLHKPAFSISYIIMLIIGLFLSSRIFVAHERQLSYPMRRFLGIVFFVGISCGIIILFIEDPNFQRYALASYYYIGAFSMIGLVSGLKFVKNFYLIHDLVCGHILFIPLFILAALQVPNHIQTWLLYHNALSGDVVVEDILKYAKKTMQSGGSDKSNDDLVEQIAELRKIVNTQQELINSGTLSAGKIRSYDRNESTDAISAMSQGRIFMGEGAATKSTFTAPMKKVLSTSAMDVWGSMAMGGEDDTQQGGASQSLAASQPMSYGATSSSASKGTTLSSDFSFTSPDVMPPR